MTYRLYLSQIIGDGASVAAAFRPALYDLLPPPRALRVVEGRRDPATAGGWSLVEADVSDTTHAAVIADARVVVLPFEDQGGGMLDLATATVGDVPAAKRTALQVRMEAVDVPLQGLTLATLLSQVVRRIKRTLLIRSWLGLDDYSEGLDALVSSVPAAKRGRINDVLVAHGFDTAGLGSLTIREALKALVEQDVWPP